MPVNHIFFNQVYEDLILFIIYYKNFLLSDFANSVVFSNAEQPNRRSLV